MQPQKTAKEAHPSRRPQNTPAATALPGPLGTALSPKQLLNQFRKLLPARMLATWLALVPQGFYQRAFTPRITLWYLIFQRLSPDHTLDKALSDALAGGADALSPRGKRLSCQLRSQATTSLSNARQGLPLLVPYEALKHSTQQIRSWVQNPLWHDWSVVLLDGSTVRLRPYGDIPEQFPPHRPGNCQSPYWCLMRVVVGFCLSTGVVVDCAMGPAKLSEQALTAQLFSGGAWAKGCW